jgi:glutathione peroxidase
MQLLLSSLLLAAIMTTNLGDHTMKTIDGADQPLSAYAGKVVLIVNVASFCGYTKQYAPLEKLYRTYKDRGLVILGFPANDFGAQEPGTEEEIKEFCSTKFDVTFPMFAKITVKGPDKHPLYAWLTSGGGNASLAGEVAWNFEKFLIGKDGAIVGRFTSKVDPMSAELVSAVEAALAK